MRTIRETLLVGAVAAGATVLAGSAAVAGPGSPHVHLTNVASANPKAPGLTSPNILSPQLDEVVVAQGSMRVENPQGSIGYYGYEGDGPLVALPGSNVEAQKTEPDKNTYLVLPGQKGADRHYDYGTHFLFQGHEVGADGYVSRVNLDADGKHRVTVFAWQDIHVNPLPDFDGSVYDPFSRTLVMTTEDRSLPGAFEVSLDFHRSSGARARDLSGSLGRAAYEGVQVDSKGQLWIAEDESGDIVAGAKQPASYLFRFVPKDPGDLSRGRLQALQIRDEHGDPIAVDPATPLTPQIAQRYSYGHSLATKWLTVHDTATDGTAAFDAFALAAAKGATPLKRPENGQFRPGTGFRQFFYTETGDTSATSTADTDVNPTHVNYGGYGGVFEIRQSDPAADHGTVRLLYAGNRAHTGFDNLAFLDQDQLLVVEDAGDTLHTDRDALDSGYVLDGRVNYAHGAKPVRFLAEGRDASATIDSALSGTDGFVNEGDNEITGIHVSDGATSVSGLLGRDEPTPFAHGWRVFWTQQHGDNTTYEVVRSSRR